MDAVVIKITSAIALDGEICKAGSLVEVSDMEARNLLHRGKAVLATEADMPADAPEPEPEPEPVKADKPEKAEKPAKASK